MKSAAAAQTMPSGRVLIRADLQRWLELLSVFVVAVSLTGLLAARLGVFEAKPVWLVGLLITGGYHHWTASRTELSMPVPVWHIALILVVGLLFRLSPYAWVLGGQDQGVYVNMAMELVRSGGLDPVDQVKSGFSDPALLEVYKNSNYGANYLPGVYSTSDGLIFQFYHLFPVWLALFGDGADPVSAMYGLTALSLLSILLFYRVAHLITGSAVAGLAAGLLLAVNPLHAFFSKFPVTEVPTLTFSLMSFALALTYWQSSRSSGGARFLALSAIAMGLLFLTRISGFMYLPLFYVVSLLTLVFESDVERRRHILFWFSGVLAVYILSVLYGLEWSGPYSRDIYRLSFIRSLGPEWKTYLPMLIAVLAAGWLVVWAATKRSRSLAIARRAACWGEKLLPLLAVLFLLAALYKIYRFGYTDAYMSDPWIEGRWHLAHKGIRSVLSTTLVVSVIYMSPFVLFAFGVSIFLFIRQALLQITLLFVICFLGYLAVLKWNVPYQPYYARYLVSEFVPYLMLFVVCSWSLCDRPRLRYWLGGALVLGGVYGSILSTAQIGKQEHGGVVESINDITSGIDQGDVILVQRTLGGHVGTQLATALTYTYGYDVVRVSDEDLERRDYMEHLSRNYDDVFLIGAGLGGSVPGFEKFRSARFVEERFAHGLLPPVKTHRRADFRVDIYEYTRPELLHYSAENSSGVVFVEGWSGQERWGRWMDGEVATIRLEINAEDNEMRDKVLTIAGRMYLTPAAPTQRIQITIGDEIVLEEVATYPSANVKLQLPLRNVASQGAPLVVEIRTPDAISPASLGYSGDRRQLGFGLSKIKVSEPATKP